MYLALSACPREAPDKRSQHFNATSPEIFRATCRAHLAILLRRIGSCWLKFNHFQT